MLLLRQPSELSRYWTKLFNDKYLENAFDVKEGTGTSVDSPPITELINRLEI